MRGIVTLVVVIGMTSSLTVASSVSGKSSTFYIYRSTNRGDSWAASRVGPPLSSRVNALAVDETRSYAGTDDGILVSSDNGVTWSRTVMGPSHRIQALLAIRGTVYAGTDHGVYVSRNHGTAWEPVMRGLTDLNVRTLATDGKIVLAGTDQHGVFVLNGTGEWRQYGSGLPRHAQVFDLAVTPTYVYAALYGKGLYQRSGSSEWKKIGEVKPLEVIARGDVIVAGHNPGGIYQSEDSGKTWRVSSGLSGRAPIWVMGEADALLFGGTSPGALVRSTDSGASWHVTATGLPRDSAVVAITGNRTITLVAISVPNN